MIRHEGKRLSPTSVSLGIIVELSSTSCYSRLSRGWGYSILGLFLYLLCLAHFLHHLTRRLAWRFGPNLKSPGVWARSNSIDILALFNCVSFPLVFCLAFYPLTVLTLLLFWLSYPPQGNHPPSSSLLARQSRRFDSEFGNTTMHFPDEKTAHDETLI
jgi:hypothetical protein